MIHVFAVAALAYVILLIYSSSLLVYDIGYSSSLLSQLCLSHSIELLAATSQFSVSIGYKMQLTGCHNDDEMRNPTCVEMQTSEVPTRMNLLLVTMVCVSFPVFKFLFMVTIALNIWVGRLMTLIM